MSPLRRSSQHGPGEDPEASGEVVSAPAGPPAEDDAEPKAEVRKAAKTRREQTVAKHRKEADLICEFLADGLPHTRAEIGEFAMKHSISDGALGRIKKERGIRHVRVQPGETHGLEKSTMAWIIPKDENVE
jgi:hypothetical protein